MHRVVAGSDALPLTPMAPSAVYNGGFAVRPENPLHDLVIRKGTVVDGTERDVLRADAVIDGNFVNRVGEAEESAWQTLDAEGLVVAPGFSDPKVGYTQLYGAPGVAGVSILSA
jgi:hypothetical protein